MSQYDDRFTSALQLAFDAAMQYRRGVHDTPAQPVDSYAQQLQRWEGVALPAQGLPPEQAVQALLERARPGLRAMTGGRFFGWVNGASHPVGLAADWLTAAWGQNAANHLAAPAAAAAETVAARWLLELLRLPPECSVGFVTGATMANFTALAAARSALLAREGWDVEADGLYGAPPLTVLVSEEAHVTVYAGLQYLGLGRRRVRRVRAQADGSMDAADFERALGEAGVGPLLVLLQAGHVNTGACDDFRRLIPLARARGAWVHVDGAFGLWARACPGRAALVDGVEQADSWATDGHKWLQLPYDSGFVIVRDADAHRRAMTAAASYLPAAQAAERDPTQYVPELSRRARGFAACALLLHLGRDGVAAMVQRHCELARDMADALAREPGVAVLNAVVLNQVLVRFSAGHAAPGAPRGGEDAGQVDDALNAAVIARVQADATCFAGGTRWHGRWVMRISVIGFSADPDDIQRSADAIRKAWRAVRREENIQFS
ncbi:pyridoxal phosphate-dependent decarboxylase family protein [Azohydromonas lata]|uniref:pyridoxal phosphate-dependent decarboxylase family protein n=1 Tax=Azohydromonas lata TaxID=45677 RepID=UPI000834FBF1|nr:pyridoxal-dependent decarboxylase [Azohydromonas lata]